MICETLVTYYNGLGEAIPEAVCGSDTDLELHTPIGAYALCTASVCKHVVLTSMDTQANDRPRCDVLSERTLLANTSPPNRSLIK